MSRFTGNDSPGMGEFVDAILNSIFREICEVCTKGVRLNRIYANF